MNPARTIELALIRSAASALAAAGFIFRLVNAAEGASIREPSSSTDLLSVESLDSLMADRADQPTADSLLPSAALGTLLRVKSTAHSEKTALSAYL